MLLGNKNLFPLSIYLQSSITTIWFFMQLLLQPRDWHPARTGADWMYHHQLLFKCGCWCSCTTCCSHYN